MMYHFRSCTNIAKKETVSKRDFYFVEALRNIKPVILCVVDSPLVLAYVIDDLYLRYDTDFRIEVCKEAQQATLLVEEISSKGGSVAICIADFNLSGISGIDFLASMGKDIGKILLTPISVTDLALEWVNQQCIDYFVTKPCKVNLLRNIDHLVENRKKSIHADLPEHIKGKLNTIRTPFFLYDINKIAAKIDAIFQYLKPDKLFYAVKCSSLPGILKTFESKECGFEVNNMGEMDKLIRLGIPADRIINSSPITSAVDLEAMYSHGVRYFAFDTKSQVDNLKQNAPGARVYLRIYTSNEGSRVKLNNRLGADPEIGVELLRYAKRAGLVPYGITFHAGSQCGSVKNWITGLKKSANLFEQFPELEMVNIGGGFPVNYNESIPTLKEIASAITNTIKCCFPSKPIIFVEPGRFLVGDSALTCASVTQIEEGNHLSRAVVDMSVFSGLIEVLEIGEKFQYPIITDETGEKRLYQIGGPTCAGTDIIAKKVLLPRLKVNYFNPKKSSRVYILNTGAYTTEYIASRQSYGFNGSNIPEVYYYENDRIYREKD